ncbi:CMGC/SRPK protein kinase [Nannizzia gypsea CBS 118893]|uniref:non-specific serine/threonine protein kinase n=1 Tax=Arthroderma gypseum (strain ATCC MYA-4604 / CBS 118893) TaxID=535722 RepID=E4UWX8_ARTGP|nr:CMGC/SRPK protein kinase [Nannizzia gypsea CBS 118893]EFR02617.1 CMGC/SRPK protein kinase [Nannizzia gypsea CBS 118893]
MSFNRTLGVSWRCSPLLPRFAVTVRHQRHSTHQLFYHTTAETQIQPLEAEERIYHPQSDVEELEGYRPSGYHPILIGDTLCGSRYKIVHKLGYGGYSTIWLAYDKHHQRYVSLKILIAAASQYSGNNESGILRLLTKGDPEHPGQRFIPALLDQFSFDGPNGHHQCLVGEPADAARSIAAQLIMGLDYLHTNDICHGDLHLGNFLLRVPGFNNLSTAELYERHGKPYENMPANEMKDPEILISDYGTSFIMSKTSSPTLHTLALCAPPEEFFHDHIIGTAADVWTLAVVLYDAMGERPLFETFAWDPDDIIGEMVNTLGHQHMPARWWKSWKNRSEFFNEDGSWISNFQRINTPEFCRLHRRMWDMGRGETPESCQWDVAGGELRALEAMLRSMMTFEPA